MSEDTTIKPIKKYPQTTAEVAQMLGINAVSNNLPMASFPGADLPTPGFPAKNDTHTPASVSADNLRPSNTTHTELLSLEEKAASQPGYLKVAKAVAPFAAVFLVGIFLYYFFFTKVDFTTVFKSKSSVSTPQVTLIQELEKQDKTAYDAWIASYYYDVTDPKLLDPESDNSGNGLTNFQKYLLNLNPKSYDTLSLGEADSQLISQGINPLSGKALTDDQKSIVAKYVDMESVMNRLALFNLQNPSRVAGAFTANNNSNTQTNNNYNNQNQNQGAVINTATSSNPLANNQVDIDTNIPGSLEIPDLKIKVPVIWSKNPKDFDKDLQVGVVHYPGTGMPGEIGTTYIAGHSSNYVWAKGSYNQVFSKLGDIALNTSFKITVTKTNGKTAVFNYVVTKTKQYTPTDQEQFQNTGKSLVALSTCWPVGSTAKRLVVFGELTQVQN